MKSRVKKNYSMSHQKPLKGKKNMFVTMSASPELKDLVYRLSRNGFDFVALKPNRALKALFADLGIELRKYKSKSDKISLAVINPSDCSLYSEKFKKSPIVTDNEDLDWLFLEISNSRNGRVTDESFNWLRMKVNQNSCHFTMMNCINAQRPKRVP